MSNANDFVIQQDSCGENLTWELDGYGTLTISGVGNMKNYNEWFLNAPWYPNRESITSVIIRDSVTSIGDYAFCKCSNLASIVIPDSVVSIGFNAFFDTAYYKDSANWENGELWFGNRLIKVDSDMVSGCYTVREGTEHIAAGAFARCRNLTSIAIPDGVTSIGNYAFDGCSSLSSIVIPDSVTSIGGSAFSYCSSLTSIVIPDGVTSIGGSAFSRCSSLTSIVIPDGVTSIGNYAFSRCSSLSSIVIPDSVTSIGKSAFYKSSKLTDVHYCGTQEMWSSLEIDDGNSLLKRATIHCADGDFLLETLYCGTCGDCLTWDLSRNGVMTISGRGNMKDFAYDLAYTDQPWHCDNDSIISVVITDGVTGIGKNAFYNCCNLSSIVIPDSVTSIGGSAFFCCSSLTSIVIPDGVTSIGSNAFYKCSSLQSVVLPYRLASIGTEAFDECPNLESITISDGSPCDPLPNHETEIGKHAFRGCSKLTKIAIPFGVTKIGMHAFLGCNQISELTIANPKCKIGVDSMGYGFPPELKKSVETYYQNLTDETLRKHFLSVKTWREIDSVTQGKIFLARHSKSLLPNYEKCVLYSDALGMGLLEILPDKLTSKECDALATFMTLFVQTASEELLQRMYGLLKNTKSAKKSLQTIQTNSPLIQKLGLTEGAQSGE